MNVCRIIEFMDFMDFMDIMDIMGPAETSRTSNTTASSKRAGRATAQAPGAPGAPPQLLASGQALAQLAHACCWAFHAAHCSADQPPPQVLDAMRALKHRSSV